MSITSGGSIIKAIGSQIYAIAGPPSDEIGFDGDIYINTLTRDFYKKSVGVWELRGNFTQGPQGPQGPQGEQGLQGIQGEPGPNTVSTSTTTNITGLLKGEGSVVSAASAGVDYAEPGDIISDHNELSNIQGGVATEYYHLNESLYNELNDIVKETSYEFSKNIVVNEYSLVLKDEGIKNSIILNPDFSQISINDNTDPNKNTKIAPDEMIMYAANGANALFDHLGVSILDEFGNPGLPPGDDYVTTKKYVDDLFNIDVVSTTSSAGTLTLSSTSAELQIITGSTTHSVALPAANAKGINISQRLVIKNRSSGDVTINRSGSDTIDGNISLILLANQSATLMSNGSNEWVIV